MGVVRHQRHGLGQLTQEISVDEKSHDPVSLRLLLCSYMNMYSLR
jgi:hypothetical protein